MMMHTKQQTQTNTNAVAILDQGGFASMPIDSVDGLRCAFLELGSTSKVWGDDDYALGARLAWVLQTFLYGRINSTLEMSPQLPRLISYQSDATSFLTRVTFTGKLGETPLRREGKELTEFLIERIYVKVFHPSLELSAIYISAPRPMGAGKRFGTFSAASDALPVGRRFGHGIVIVHTSFDRAVHDGLSHALEARENVLYQDGMHCGPFVETGWGELLQWAVNTPCPYHDCHGAFRKAVEPHASKDKLKDLHVSIESLRNSFSMIAREVAQFARLYVQFVDRPTDGVL
jgi:hypothetical protein